MRHSVESLIAADRKRRGIKPFMPNAKYVEAWWPKPKIRYAGELWGFECYSPSKIGFHPRDGDYSESITCECKAYGTSPEEAYDKWCGVFPSWNKEHEWRN